MKLLIKLLVPIIDRRFAKVLKPEQYEQWQDIKRDYGFRDHVLFEHNTIVVYDYEFDVVFCALDHFCTSDMRIERNETHGLAVQVAKRINRAVGDEDEEFDFIMHYENQLELEKRVS